MELNWSTFALEIINFLILIWILKRFLYRPVLNVIAARRADIEKTVAEAQALRDEAQSLESDYRGRLEDWEQERRQAREQLAREIETERAEKLAALKLELDEEREKSRVADARRQADARDKTEQTAMLQAARFAARLLEQLADPALEQRLVERTLKDLSRLPEDRLAALRNRWGRSIETAVVSSAFPLSDKLRQALRQAITTLTGQATTVRFEQDEKLMSGVRIRVGAWLLGANLRDELKSLAEFVHDNRRV